MKKRSYFSPNQSIAYIEGRIQFGGVQRIEIIYTGAGFILKDSIGSFSQVLTECKTFHQAFTKLQALKKAFNKQQWKGVQQFKLKTA